MTSHEMAEGTAPRWTRSVMRWRLGQRSTVGGTSRRVRSTRAACVTGYAGIRATPAHDRRVAQILYDELQGAMRGQ